MIALRDDELWIAGCLQTALPGLIVGQHDVGGNAQHDLDLSVNGITVAAVEITAAADPAAVQSWKLLDTGATRWQDARLGGGWRGRITPGARIDKLKGQLPGLLKMLEVHNCWEVPRYARNDDEIARAIRDLGVIAIRRGPTDHPGSITIIPDLPVERAATFLADTGDAVAAWIGEWSADGSQTHNLDKLAKSGAAEKHLFVILPAVVTTAPMTVTDVLMRGITPTVAPNLPSVLTHVWLATTWGAGCGFRWSASGGWQSFAHDASVDRTTLGSCTCL